MANKQVTDRSYKNNSKNLQSILDDYKNKTISKIKLQDRLNTLLIDIYNQLE